jgi:tetratricopeptide (TPR) repeat protein
MAQPSVEEILDLAIRHANAGLPDRARALCEHALAAHGAHPAVHQLLAMLALQQGQAAEARRQAAASLALRPDHVPTLLAAGDAALALREPAAAARALERAVALAPAHADAWFRLGAARQDLRDFDAAAAALREALRLKPDSAETAVNLGIVLQDAGRVGEAMAAYGMAYALREETFGRIAHALATPNAGRLYLELDDLRAALQAAATAGSHSPDRG